jgi:hypothetical protein
MDNDKVAKRIILWGFIIVVLSISGVMFFAYTQSKQIDPITQDMGTSLNGIIAFASMAGIVGLVIAIFLFAKSQRPPGQIQ